jgi:hypothetical protein
MKTLKKVVLEFMLPFIFCWFFMTILVDIITIPTVFRNSRSVEDAGKIGMVVFGRFNFFEIFFGLMVLSAALIHWSQGVKKWVYFALPLFTLSLLYTFYMTPMITNTTYQIHQTVITDPMYAVLQSQHARFHTMYRYFDSGKLLWLLTFGVAMVIDRVRSNKETV